MKKTMKTIAVATVLGITASTFNPVSAALPTTAVTAEAASTVSIKEAAQKIAEEEKKAYNQKKNVTVSVSVSCPSKSKVKDTVKELIRTTGCAEIGVEDVENVVAAEVKPAFAQIWCWVLKSNKEFGGSSFTGTATLSGKTLTVKIIIKNSKKFRDAYEENYYTGLNVAEIEERVAGMSEKDKAWTVGQWVHEHMGYYWKNQDKSMTAKVLNAGKARGNCSGLARTYQKYACLVGVDAAVVLSYEDNHDWNAVRIDGEIYHLDINATVERFSRSYEVLSVDPSREWVCSLYGIKDWTGEDSIGEYCLVTTDEMYAASNDCGSGFVHPSKWEYRWAF